VPITASSNWNRSKIRTRILTQFLISDNVAHSAYDNLKP
jgi:hypothetical protein